METTIGDKGGLSRAAEILGERWNILLLRELSLGPRRFGDLRRALSGMSPSVLAGRLVRLEEKRIVRRRELPPPAAFPVYELDDAGLAFAPVLDELARWGLRFHSPPASSGRRTSTAASGNGNRPVAGSSRITTAVTTGRKRATGRGRPSLQGDQP